jgi:hypothetical protein
MKAVFTALALCLITADASALAQTPPPESTRPAGPRIAQMGSDPASAPLLFREVWSKTPPQEQPVTGASLSNKDLTLHLYGDAAGVRKSAHPTENYLYTGETVSNWGLTVSDPTSRWDLTVKGKVMLKTRNSGYLFTHVMLKTVDGQWWVSEEGNPESTAWIEREYLLPDLHWRHLMMADTPGGGQQRKVIPSRVPLVATQTGAPDLSRVEEIGFTDLTPGGWIPASSRVTEWAVYGKKVPR